MILTSAERDKIVELLTNETGYCIEELHFEEDTLVVKFDTEELV